MNVPSNWQDWGAIVAVVGSGGALVVWMIRNALRGSFVPADSHAALDKRVATLEHKAGVTPGHLEFAQLTQRVGAVETGVGVVQASLTGLAEGQRRSERMLDLLTKHLLGKDDE